MIVKCDKCQTRFKIPDEKVTEKGVKVRCTKCQNTFRVKKAAADGAPALTPAGPPPSKPPSVPAVAPEAADPFAQFGGSLDAPGKPAPAKATAAAQRHVPSEVFELLTRVAPIPSGNGGLEVSRAAAPEFAFEPPPPLETPAPPLEAPPPRGSRSSARPSPPGLALAEPAVAATSGAATLPAPAPLLMDVPLIGDSPRPGRASTKWTGGAGSEFAVPEPESIPLPTEPDRAMFDMPAPPPPAAAPRPSGETSAIGRIRLVQQPAASSADPRPVVTADAEDSEPMAPPSRARKVSGLILNLGFALALILALLAIAGVYLNEGKLDFSSFSAERLKGLFAAPQDVATLDISNGLYDTKSGRSVFYVRGEVENRGEKARRVKVRAEILDGELLVRAAEGWAGATPNPEDLFAVGTKEDLDAMNARLEQKAGAVAPGARAPFVIAFHEYPPALSGLRLKVTVVGGPAGSTAAR